MSLQWTLVAGVLYAEIFLILLFILPFVSAKRWSNVFKSRFVQVLSQQAHWYFGLFFLLLVLLLFDAIREMRKYSTKEHNEHSHLETELQNSMRLFRAQRNFYISGFALFLALVIRRFVAMISKQATLMAENEAALKQAMSATSTARNLMAGEAAQNTSNEAHQEEIKKLGDEITNLKDKLTKAEKDKEAMESQAKSVGAEYDRLTEEYRKLELKLNVSDKKDD